MWAIDDLANVRADDDLTNYHVDAILRDRTRVHIRAIRANDKERLARHFDGLNPDSRYHRFFGIKNGFTSRELRYFTEPDFPRHVALVVTIAGGGGADTIVSDGRYVVLPDRICAAELALSVVDSCQRRGIGALVLECLIATARRVHLDRLEADVLASNRGAMRFLIRHGFESVGISAGVCRVALSVRDHGAPKVAAGHVFIGPGPDGAPPAVTVSRGIDALPSRRIG
jgi:GNAT superfamily N-acetyltransferase